jgi:ribonuclease HI
MLRLPVTLERRLIRLFPRASDREAFIVNSLSRALDDAEADPGSRPMAEAEPALPETIGGTLHLFSDGGSRGNPGQAAIAAILEDPLKGEVLQQHAERIGVETNNVAEYRALIEGLKMAKRFQPARLICHLDSELVVRQLNGQYQVKMETLKPFFQEIQSLAEDFNDVVFTHIPREDNYRADALVNKVLDELKQGSAARGIPAKPNSQPSLFRPGREQNGWRGL